MMLSRLSLVIALGLGSSLVAGCTPRSTTGTQTSANIITPTGTTSFSSKEGNYAIYYPEKATLDRKSGTEKGVKYDMLTSTCRTGPVSYIVLATTIAEGIDTSNSTSFLDGLQKGWLESSGATLDSSRDITLKDASGTEIPGREFAATLKTAGKTAKARVFAYSRPKISYQVMAVGLDTDFAGQKAQIDKVLRSFRLLDPNA